MQAFGFEAIPAAYSERQSFRHRHTPMHTCRAIDQSRDAISQWLMPSRSPKLFHGPAILVLVRWVREEALGKFVVPPRVLFTESLRRRLTLGQVEGEDGTAAGHLCRSVIRTVGDEMHALPKRCLVAFGMPYEDLLDWQGFRGHITERMTT